MTTFESPLGKKRVINQPLKEFDVPDESDNPFDVNNAIRQPGMKQLNMAEIADFQKRLSAGFSEDEEASNQAEMEQEFRQARTMKKAGKERLTEAAKRRLEALLGMVRLNRNALIGEMEFVLQTLTGKEMRDAIKAASAFDSTVESPFEIRNQFLARSIVSIAGVEFEQFVGSDKLEIKLLFVEELDDIILNRIYDEYLLLTAEAKKKFGISNKNDAEEVVSDIKK